MKIVYCFKQPDGASQTFGYNKISACKYMHVKLI